MREKKLAPWRIREKCFPGCSKKNKISSLGISGRLHRLNKKIISAQRFWELEKS